MKTKSKPRLCAAFVATGLRCNMLCVPRSRFCKLHAGTSTDTRGRQKSGLYNSIKRHAPALAIAASIVGIIRNLAALGEQIAPLVKPFVNQLDVIQAMPLSKLERARQIQRMWFAISADDRRILQQQHAMATGTLAPSQYLQG